MFKSTEKTRSEELELPKAVIELQKLLINKYLEKVMIIASMIENTFRTDLIDDSCN